MFSCCCWGFTGSWEKILTLRICPEVRICSRKIWFYKNKSRSIGQFDEYLPNYYTFGDKSWTFEKKNFRKSNNFTWKISNILLVVTCCFCQKYSRAQSEGPTQRVKMQVNEDLFLYMEHHAEHKISDNQNLIRYFSFFSKISFRLIETIFFEYHHLVKC